MATYYDDNFGFWNDMEEWEMREFYFKTQKRSVVKVCEGCGREVKILPEYAYCNSCADMRERGLDI